VLGRDSRGQEITLEEFSLFPAVLGQLDLSTLTEIGCELIRLSILIATDGKGFRS
jgi:hypothetical protein